VVPNLIVEGGIPAFDLLLWGGGGLVLFLALAGVGLVFWQRNRSLPAPGEVPSPQVVAPSPLPSSLADVLRQALSRSRVALRDRFDAIFGAAKNDDSLFEELEEALISADVGVATTTRILEDLRIHAKGADRAILRERLREHLRSALKRSYRPLQRPSVPGPWVILVVGVNGSGKTTTIGKLAGRFRDEGLKVLVAAGDTYRAAAVDQLAVWAQRAGADIVRGPEGGDPGAVVFDALQAAKARGADVVLVDTAGRLQTARPLMDQLAKIRKVITKVQPSGPHDTLLVLDGTMGQNGLSQATLFHEATPLTGVVVTKLDGTAKGGMVVTLAAELGLPVQFIGVGEKVADLRPFDPDLFVEAIA
jgi:fused signal recognition particle receptor